MLQLGVASRKTIPPNLSVSPTGQVQVSKTRRHKFCCAESQPWPWFWLLQYLPSLPNVLTLTIYPRSLAASKLPRRGDRGSWNRVGESAINWAKVHLGLDGPTQENWERSHCTNGASMNETHGAYKMMLSASLKMAQVSMPRSASLSFVCPPVSCSTPPRREATPILARKRAL